MTRNSKIGELAHEFLERRFAGELVDPMEYVNKHRSQDGLLHALTDALEIHRQYLEAMIRDHRLIGLIGRGGFGEVYIAERTRLDIRSRCAVKIVPKDRTTELRGLAELKTKTAGHHHIVPIEDFDEAGRRYFWYSMPLAENMSRKTGKYLARSLAETLKFVRNNATEPLPAQEIAVIGCAMASALRHLHSRSLVHRDVKPGNIIFVDGRWMLADIGLLATSASAGRAGTESYLPPEGPSNRARDDLYALGLTLGEALTGKPIHEIKDQLRTQAVSAVPPIERPLWQVLRKACADDAEERFPSARDMLAALEPLRQLAPPRKKSWLRRLLGR